MSGSGDSDRRGGRVIYLCPADDITQSAPDGVGPGEHSNWSALEQIEYIYKPLVWDAEWPPPEPIYNKYTYNQSVGPAALGYKPFSSKLTQGFTPDNAIADEGNEFYWYGDFGFTQTRPIDVNKLPEDAYVDYITISAPVKTQPPEWQYAVHKFTHNHPYLPQFTDIDDQLILPGTARWTEIYGFIGRLDPHEINLRDFVFNTFSMSFSLRHESGSSVPSVTPNIKIPYFVMEVYWQAPAAEAVDGWAGVSMGGSATFGASTIENVKRLDGHFEASKVSGLSIYGDRYLLGSFLSTLTSLGEISIVPGVDDISGTFYGNATLSSDLSSRTGLAGNIPLSLKTEGGLIKVGQIAGVSSMTLGFLASLRKVGLLWTGPADLSMSMSLSPAPLGGSLGLAGSFPGQLSATANVNGSISISGTMAASLKASSHISRSSPLSAEFTGSMNLAASSVNAIMGLTGEFIGKQELWSSITLLFLEPSLSENTLYMQAESRTIHQQRKAADVVLEKPERN